MTLTDKTPTARRYSTSDPINHLPRIQVSAEDCNYLSATNQTKYMLGYHSEIGSSVAMNATGVTPDAYGHYVWFRFNSATSMGDGEVRIRGRRLEDDGTEGASPVEDLFDMTSASADDVFVSTSRLFGPALIDSTGSFLGNVDYGLVSPFNAKGMLWRLEGIELQWEPDDNSDYRLIWQAQKWAPGASGGLSDIVAQRTYRDVDATERAQEDIPGNDHHIDLDTTFDPDNTEGLILTINRKNMRFVNFRVYGVQPD